MENKNRNQFGIFILALSFIFFISFVSAVDFTPNGDINLRNVYAIENATNITAAYYCNQTECHNMSDFLASGTAATYTAGSNLTLTGTVFSLNTTGVLQWLQDFFYNITQTDTEISNANATMKNYVDGQDIIYNDSMKSYVDGTFIPSSSEGDLNVNSSDYWDGLDTYNITQMTEDSGKLTIRNSWFTSFWNIIFGTKTTDDLTEGSTNLYDNQSWNETRADGIYVNVDGDTMTGNLNMSGNDIIMNQGNIFNATDISLNAQNPVLNITTNFSGGDESQINILNTNSFGYSGIRYINNDGDEYFSGLFSRDLSLAAFSAVVVPNESVSGMASVGGPMFLITTENNSIYFGGGPSDSLLDTNWFFQIEPTEEALVLQGDKKIRPIIVDGGSALVMQSEDVLDAGGFPFVWIAQDSNNDTIIPLWLQNGNNNSYSSVMNSFGPVPKEWQLYNTNMTSSVSNLSDLFDISNYIDYCSWLQNEKGLVNESCKYFADTSGRVVPLLFGGDLEIHRSAVIHEGLSVFQDFNYLTREGNDFSIYNGSLHLQTPVDFEQGFTAGEDVTIFTADFQTSISPFVNIQSDTSNWQSRSSALCNDGNCANSNGISTSGNIIMQENASTSNVNGTKLSFIYSVVGLVATDDFIVTVNNNSGSGDVVLFTDAGTETLISEVISLPAGFDNISIVTINFVCDATASNRDCFVDNVKLNGTASATTLINVSGFDSVITMSDGSLDSGGYPVRGIFYNAENDTIYIRGNVSQSTIEEEDLVITDTITLKSETISYWANLTQFIPNMLLTDGSRSLTANWAQGDFNFTNVNSWFLGKVGWSSIIGAPSFALAGDCPSGQFVQNATTGGVECAAAAGSGDITSVIAGDGLIGGGVSGDVTLNVSSDSCGANEASKYNGTHFNCVATITSETDPIFVAWDNFTGIPHATPANGDVTHFSWGDEIYDFVIGLGYSTTVGTITSVAAGSGMDFTSITSTGSVIMGTPSTVGGSTSNGVTATSHTHAVTSDDSGDCSAGVLCGGGHTHSNYIESLLEDTTPQLGGYLDTNGENIGSTTDEIENIYISTNTRIYFGDGQEASQYYNGTNLIITG